MAVKKILIADDELDILDVLEKKLKQNNYEVLALSKGKEVSEKAVEFKPDLFILDIVMPDMDGYAIGLRLRSKESFRATPIIYMTGKELATVGIQKRISELGFCDFITKPCTFENLLAKVNSHT